MLNTEINKNNIDVNRKSNEKNYIVGYTSKKMVCVCVSLWCACAHVNNKGIEGFCVG